MRAKRENSSTICFIDATSRTMVLTPSSSAVPRLGSPSRYFLSSRSAERRIGVSGFLISCATRRAASFQVASFCAWISSVRSSSTMTWPVATRRCGSLERRDADLERLPLAAQAQLHLAPGAAARAAVELAQLAALGVAPGLLERPAEQLRLLLVEHRQRGVVAGRDAAFLVDRDDAGGDVLEHGGDQRRARRRGAG